MKYTYDCEGMGKHEPMMMEVEADNDDMAMDMMMEKVKAHLGEMHMDMDKDDMTDEKMMGMIKAGWKKEDGMADKDTDNMDEKPM